MRLSPHRIFLLSLFFLGLVPGFIILFLLKFDAGHLVIAGQALGEYSLNRLFSGLMSTMLPMLLLVPVALISIKEKAVISYGLAFVTPILLFGPSLVCGYLVGGREMGPSLLVSFLLSLFLCCFLLWLELGVKLLDLRLSMLAYAVAWSLSGFLGYLSEYIVPYLEIPMLRSITYLHWIMPQLQSGPAAMDTFISSGEFSWTTMLPTLVQIPVLLGLIFWLNKRE